MSFLDVVKILENKTGFEFGGPTELFDLPIHNMSLYPYVSLDGGNIFDDNHFQEIKKDFIYGKKLGKQFNVDCTNIDDVKRINNKYDFIVTSHVIEHIANPIKAIKMWSNELLNNNGYVLSIIPDYRFCFDRNRPLTSIDHIIQDFENNVLENDITHIDEQKKLHDWTYGGHKNFYELCDINEKTRVVHHHTFTPETVETLFNKIGLKTIITFKHDDLNIVNLSIKND